VTFFARSSNVDVPMCFWASAAGFVGVGVIQAPGRRGMLAFCVLCILAVCTKEQIAFALAPVCLLVGLLTLVRHPGGLTSAIGDLAWGLALGALVYALLTDLLWNPSLYQERLSTWQTNLAWFEEKTAESLTTMDLLREGGIAFVHVVGPGVAALAVLALLLAALRLDLVGLFLGLCCVGYGVAITVYLGYVQPRFFFPSALFAALLVGRGFAVLFALPKTGFRTGCLSVVKIVFFASVAHSLLIAWALVVEPRGAALKWIAEHVIVADKEDPQFVGGYIEGSSNFNFLAYEAEVYQNENLLPGVRTLGLDLHREEDMTQESFLERKPPLVVVADNFRWMWDDEQNKFVTWLFEGPPEYRVVRFGPEAMGYRSDFMHGGPRSRIWPNLVVLVLDP